MSKTNLPGFTADVSLSKASGHYRTGGRGIISATRMAREISPAAIATEQNGVITIIDDAPFQLPWGWGPGGWTGGGRGTKHARISRAHLPSAATDGRTNAPTSVRLIPPHARCAKRSARHAATGAKGNETASDFVKAVDGCDQRAYGGFLTRVERIGDSVIHRTWNASPRRNTPTLLRPTSQPRYRCNGEVFSCVWT